MTDQNANMSRCKVCDKELVLSNANSRYNVYMCLDYSCRVHNQPQGYIPVSVDLPASGPLGDFLGGHVRRHREGSPFPSKETLTRAYNVNKARKKANYRELRANGCAPSVATKNMSDKRAKALLAKLKKNGGKSNEKDL